MGKSPGLPPDKIKQTTVYSLQGQFKPLLEESPVCQFSFNVLKAVLYKTHKQKLQKNK